MNATVPVSVDALCSISFLGGFMLALLAVAGFAAIRRSTEK
jgi:hypothetical protein